MYGSRVLTHCHDMGCDTDIDGLSRGLVAFLLSLQLAVTYLDMPWNEN